MCPQGHARDLVAKVKTRAGNQWEAGTIDKTYETIGQVIAPTKRQSADVKEVL